MGPFLDAKSSDLQEGDLCYMEKDTKELTFLDYDDMMKVLMTMIKNELGHQNTQVILIPSAREINHIYPLPQPPYPGKDNFIHVGNPQCFRINDITFGTINADVIKELIISTVVKNI